MVGFNKFTDTFIDGYKDGLDSAYSIVATYSDNRGGLIIGNSGISIIADNPNDSIKHRQNCRFCGAPNQYGVCEYCGSVL